MARSLKRVICRCSRPEAACALVLTILGLISCAAAQETVDVVRYRDAKTGHERKRTGEIVEFSGKALVMKVTSGNEVAIPTGDVIDFDTHWTESHREANRLFAANDFAGALTAYNRALVEKQPQWVVRRVMSQRVLCLSALNKPLDAADSFFRIVKVDTDTQYFGVIPLNWQSQQPDSRLGTECNQWINGNDVFEQLVAASWLLSGSSRLLAEKKLNQLTVNSDSRVALLATAQLWRIAAVSATADDFERWQEIIARMPTELRAGPLYVCGSTMLSRGEDVDRSVLTLMRVPTLYPQHHQLAARCLFESAAALKQATRDEEAEIMLRELIANYPETSYAAEARK